MIPYRIGVINQEIGTTGILETLLREGHTIYLVIVAANFTISDATGLGLKYKNFKVVNTGDHYQTEFVNNLLLLERLKKLNLEIDFWWFDYVKGFTEHLHLADFLRTLNKPVIGPTQWTTMIEANREIGKTVAEQVGLGCLTKAKLFYEIKEAIKFATKNKKNYLIKGAYITCKPINHEDCIDMLSQPHAPTMFGMPLFLEAELEQPYSEVAFSTYFNGKEYYPYILVNREYKEVQPQGRGNIMCGEAGNLCFWTKFEELPLPIKDAYTKLRASLIANKYQGFIDINTLVKEGQFHFLEWTTRTGIPTEHIISTYFERWKSYGALLAFVAGINRLPPEPVFQEKIVAICMYFYANTVDMENKHQPMIHGLPDKPIFILPAKPMTALAPTVGISLATACYRLNHREEIIASALNGDFVAPGNQMLIAISMADSYHAAKGGALFLLNKIKCWSHTYREDIGDLVLEILPKIREQKFKYQPKTKYLPINEQNLAAYYPSLMLNSQISQLELRQLLAKLQYQFKALKIGPTIEIE